MTVASHAFVIITRFFNTFIVGATHGFSEIASSSGEKLLRKKKRKIDYGDAAFQQSMMNIFDALSSSIGNKTKQNSEQEDEGSKGSNNNPVYELLQYCTNFTRRMAVSLVKKLNTQWKWPCLNINLNDSFVF